jgi:hypothetical protein
MKHFLLFMFNSENRSHKLVTLLAGIGGQVETLTTSLNLIVTFNCYAKFQKLILLKVSTFTYLEIYLIGVAVPYTVGVAVPHRLSCTS